MHYLLFYDYVSDYVNKRAPLRPAHLELVRRAHDRGELVMAGALGDAHCGAVLVFRGESPRATASSPNGK